jgi:hypothetical protein
MLSIAVLGLLMGFALDRHFVESDPPRALVKRDIALSAIKNAYSDGLKECEKPGNSRAGFVWKTEDTTYFVQCEGPRCTTTAKTDTNP